MVSPGGGALDSAPGRGSGYTCRTGAIKKGDRTLVRPPLLLIVFRILRGNRVTGMQKRDKVFYILTILNGQIADLIEEVIG